MKSFNALTVPLQPDARWKGVTNNEKSRRTTQN